MESGNRTHTQTIETISLITTEPKERTPEEVARLTAPLMFEYPECIRKPGMLGRPRRFRKDEADERVKNPMIGTRCNAFVLVAYLGLIEFDLEAYLCRCDCGTAFKVTVDDIKRRCVLDCGCGCGSGGRQYPEKWEEALNYVPNFSGELKTPFKKFKHRAGPKRSPGYIPKDWQREDGADHPSKYIGRRSGECVAVADLDKNEKGEYMLMCLCDCGQLFNTTAERFRKGRVKSCGHVPKVEPVKAEPVKTEIIEIDPELGRSIKGEHFGALTPDTMVKMKKCDAHSRWVCICDCGRTRVVKTRDLVSGAVISCGCLSRTRSFAAHSRQALQTVDTSKRMKKQSKAKVREYAEQTKNRLTSRYSFKVRRSMQEQAERVMSEDEFLLALKIVENRHLPQDEKNAIKLPGDE